MLPSCLTMMAVLPTPMPPLMARTVPQAPVMEDDVAPFRSIVLRSHCSVGLNFWNVVISRRLSQVTRFATTRTRSSTDSSHVPNSAAVGESS